MKKKIIISAIIIIIATIWVLSYKLYVKNEEKKEHYQTLPDFAFYSLEKDSLEKASLQKNMYSVLIFFDSHCDYCKLELKSIEKNIDKFKDVQIAMISSQPADTIKAFKKQFNFSAIPNTGMYYADLKELVEKFIKYSVPSVFIYDAEDKLAKQFTGFTKVEKILEVIHSDQENKK
jgi:peroxiredoxin